MAEFVTVGRVDDVPQGEIREFNVHGQEIAIVNVDGAFYAIDGLCTHRECSLADGDLEDTTIACVCHGSKFDVRTGEVLNPPASEPVSTYGVRDEDGELKVEV
ncbi:MAG: non-heme iron oxygenase ferredoxin subunit [Actinomycetota bacterium]